MKKTLTATALALVLSSVANADLFTQDEVAKEGALGKSFIHVAFKENKSQEEWLKDTEEFGSLTARIKKDEYKKVRDGSFKKVLDGVVEAQYEKDSEEEGFTSIGKMLTPSKKISHYEVITPTEKALKAVVKTTLQTASYLVSNFYGSALTAEVTERATNTAMDFFFGKVKPWSFAALNRWTAAKDAGIKAAPYGANLLNRVLDYGISKFF